AVTTSSHGFASSFQGAICPIDEALSIPEGAFWHFIFSFGSRNLRHSERSVLAFFLLPRRVPMPCVAEAIQ
ncbi:hypothetical protein, partial [Cohnella boryungensis]